MRGHHRRTAKREIAFWDDGKPYAVRYGKEGYVYFATSDCGLFVKIGFSRDPESRIKCLRRRANGKIGRATFLACTVGTMADEQAFHERFSHLAVGGEWFSMAAEIVELLHDEERFQRFCPSSELLNLELFATWPEPGIAIPARERLAAIWSWAT